MKRPDGVGDVQENVFSFPLPDELECVVERYTVGDRVIDLKVITPNGGENRFLEFQLVLYFSGPLSWTGANFQIRPWQECVHLLMELNWMPGLKQMSEDMQREVGEKHFRLYTVSALSPNMEIKILAGNAYLRPS